MIDEFGTFTKREAQICIESYAAGVEAVGDTIDAINPLVEGLIPYSHLKSFITNFAESLRTTTMARVMAKYSDAERSDDSFRM